ncbi:MAG: N-acetylglucosamine-6-phosphate deacetylase [Clostridiales bacterium]|nr:N-acetylglucosamine-6-phosphate deacetylase [Clostridiales bacterium]
MRLTHADIVDSSFLLQRNRTLTIENGMISAISENSDSGSGGSDEYDLSGFTLIPGFIDLHIHGALGADTSDGDVEGLRRISLYLAGKGVTSFCPTTMMIPKEKLIRVLRAADAFRKEDAVGARMLGVRLEGPFLSKEKCGVQNTDYAMEPSSEYVKEILEGLPDDLISIIDITPELPGTSAFVSEMKDRYVLSAAHTAASYDVCKASIAEGIRHGTHLFNAMEPLSHHAPGSVGALLEDPSVTCELICDGMHVHTAVLKIALAVLGEDRAVVVSDAMRAAGMPDGEYDLGGTMVHVKEGRTDFGNGRLAGSTTDIHAEFLKLLDLKIPFTTALRACTINPAKVLHIDQMTGSIEAGKYADLVALDEEYRIRKVFVKGNLVYEK